MVTVLERVGTIVSLIFDGCIIRPFPNIEQNDINNALVDVEKRTGLQARVKEWHFPKLPNYCFSAELVLLAEADILPIPMLKQGGPGQCLYNAVRNLNERYVRIDAPRSDGSYNLSN